MEKQEKINRTLLHSVWALSGFSLAALMLTRELEALTAAAILTLFPFFLYFDLKGRTVRARWLENSLILLDFCLGAYRFIFLKDSFLLIVADFLVFFLLLKTAFKKEKSDLLQMIYLTFFLLLSCSTLSLDFTFVFSFVLYILIASWTLSIFNLAGVDSTEAGAAPQSFDLKPVFSRIYKNTGITLALAVFFALSIFVFFPRLSIVVFQGAFLGPVHQSGFTEKVVLEKSAKIFKDSQVVMRVEIEPPQNSGGPFYIRGQTLSSFDGAAWSRGNKHEKQISFETYKTRVLKSQRVAKNKFQILIPEERELLKKELGLSLDEGKFIKQKIFLESLDSTVLFAVPWASVLTAKLPRISVRQDYSLERPSVFKGRVAYEVISIAERPTEILILERMRKTAKKNKEAQTSRIQLPFASQSAEEEISENLALPDKQKGAQAPIDLGSIQKLVNRIISRRDSALVKAKKIERSLRQNYSYTLDLKGAGARSPLEEFLFTTKAGHCEYFASAMVVMLRLEGIPARVVTGFLMDEKNSSGGYYVVRAQDAHTWVEAYLGGLWVEFDPTPRVARFEAQQITLWDKLRQQVDYLNFLWNDRVLGYDVEAQERVARKVELKSGDVSRNLDRLLGTWRRRFFPEGAKWGLGGESFRAKDTETEDRWLNLRRSIWFAATFGLFLAFLARKKLMYYFKFKRNDRLVNTQFYGEMLRILARRRYKRRGVEAPNEFALRVTREPIKNSLNFLTDLYYKVRFGRIRLESRQTTEIKISLKEIEKLLPAKK